LAAILPDTRRRYANLVTVFAAFAVACAGGAADTPDASVEDAGPADGDDGGDPDGGAPDAGRPDAGPPLPCGTPWGSDRQFGSPLADAALSLAIAPGDTVYVGGYEEGVEGATTVDPSGAARGVVTELSHGGVELSKRAFAAGSTSVEAIAVAGSDALLIGRSTGRFGTFTPGGMFDIFVARAPLDGSEPEVLWQGGTERPEHPRSIALADGQVLGAGYFDVYIPTNYVERSEDELTFAVRLAPGTPELAWLRSGDSSGSDWARAIAADPVRPGGYAVVGRIESGTSRGPWVRLVGPDGALVWSRRLTTISLDDVAGVVFAPDGNLVVAGTTYSAIYGKPYGQQDVFVAKLDRENGATLWSTQYGSTESDLATAMAIDARGTIAVAGETLGDFAGGTPNAGDYDVFALRVSADGQVAGAWQKGSPADDAASAIAFDSCARVIVAGSTKGALFGTPLGERDAWVAEATF
jgi:hypothetical protein